MARNRRRSRTLLAAAISATLLPFAACGTEPATATYAPSDEAIPNPERGFFTQTEDLPWDPLPDVSASGQTLIRGIFRLDALRGRDQVPQAYLAAMEARFDEARAAGVKLIVRFAYNYSDTSADAPLGRVLTHIDQVMPVVTANIDVVALVEAGFIGAWGEWHDSANNLIGGVDDPASGTFAFAAPNDATRAITERLLARVPASRQVALRYVGTKRALAGTDASPVPATRSAATSPAARLGHTNDCFLSDENEQGLFPEFAGDTLRAYLAADALATVNVGETCVDNAKFTSCENAVAQLEAFRYTALNSGFQRSVLARWRREGCWNEINKRLGYRLTLVDVVGEPGRLQSGGRLQMTLRLRNDGFAPPINERPVVLVLRNKATGRVVRVPTGISATSWTPGDHDVPVDVALPALAAGTYELLLHLPDPDPRLRDRPAYAIRLANAGTWEPQTGYNDLLLHRKAAAGS